MQHYKKALLVVSFGTTFPNAIEAIENIERAFQNTFPDYDFFRVFYDFESWRGADGTECDLDME